MRSLTEGLCSSYNSVNFLVVILSGKSQRIKTKYLRAWATAAPRSFVTWIAGNNKPWLFCLVECELSNKTGKLEIRYIIKTYIVCGY